MALHRRDPGDMKPCRHMENLVSTLVDDRLTGVAKAYTNWHIAQCPKCQAGKQNLIALKQRLSELGPDTDHSSVAGLPPAQWTSIDAALLDVDESHE